MTRWAGDEQEFQDGIVAHARAMGWEVHFIPNWLYRLAFASMKRGRRRDRVWPDKGFPDLMLKYEGPGFVRMIAAELKTSKGRVAEEQKRWLASFRAMGFETYVWRQDDLDAILALLREPERMPQ